MSAKGPKKPADADRQGEWVPIHFGSILDFVDRFDNHAGFGHRRRGPRLTIRIFKKSTAAASRKLAGKEWIPVAFKRRRAELLAMSITAAGEVMAGESQTARDCAKPLSAGYCTNLLRTLKAWPKARRNSPKRRRK